MSDLIHEPTEFYMVWTKTGWPPRWRHDTRAEATAEAERLARKLPGKKFIILQAVEKIAAEAPKAAAA